MPNPTGKRELRKGRWLMLKSSPGLFINHNLKHVKPLHPRQSVPEAYQARTKKPKRWPTNSCTEPQGTKTVKQLGNTANDYVNRTAKNPIC